MNKTEVESLNPSELRAAAKKAGIKYGKMSLLRMRTALVDTKQIPSRPKWSKRPRRTKVLLVLVEDDGCDCDLAEESECGSEGRHREVHLGRWTHQSGC